MAWFYLSLIFFIVIFGFLVLRRPMYEVMFMAFLALLIASGNADGFFGYMMSTSHSYLLFTMMAFMVFGTLVEETGIITDLLDIIVALVGKFSGGAGYVALLCGAAVGSFCGSGPGTVAAAGTFTIPAMNKTGFSAETAAMVAAAAGSLGPIIPPSAAIPIMFMMLEAAQPGYCTASQFWLFAWPVSFWLVIQRLITLYIIVRRQHLHPIPQEDRMPLGEALKKGWHTLIILFLMIVPFVLDNMFAATVIKNRIGEYGSARFSEIVLVTVPAVSCLMVLFLWYKKGNKPDITIILHMVSKCVYSIAPIVLMTFSGFAMAALLSDIGMAEEIVSQIETFAIPKWAVVIVAPLIFTLFGMFMESSSVYFLLGPVFIPVAISVGINPAMAAMMVNVLCNGMGQISPPFALCLLISMGIAEADFSKTSYQAIFWCFTQYVVIVFMLFELLPMFGMMI